MLQPKRVKYRKSHKGHRRGNAQVGNTIVFGDFGLQALEPAWITSRQIESARRAITHHIRRGGNIWIRIFPSKPVTKKPAETRQGGGKGAPDHWVAVVKPGRILFEMAGVGQEAAKEAMRLATPVLLEPVMKVEVETPDEYQGDLVGDINRRRGQIHNMNTRNELTSIQAFVPLETMFGYATDVRSLSKGRATYTMEPSHFEQVPSSVLSKIVETTPQSFRGGAN